MVQLTPDRTKLPTHGDLSCVEVDVAPQEPVDAQGDATVTVEAPRVKDKAGVFVTVVGQGPILLSETYEYPAS